jgi:hypothetical protein
MATGVLDTLISWKSTIFRRLIRINRHTLTCRKANSRIKSINGKLRRVCLFIQTDRNTSTSGKSDSAIKLSSCQALIRSSFQIVGCLNKINWNRNPCIQADE